MNKKIIAVIVAILVVAAVSVFGYIKLVPNEDELYNEQMSIVLNDTKLIEKEFTNNSSLNLNNSSDVNAKIEKTTSIIDKDLKILENLNNSISNSTRKEYIGLSAEYLKEGKNMLNVVSGVMDIIEKLDKNNITVNEALSKMTDYEKQMNKTSTKLTSIEKQMKDYEKKYTFVLINASS